MKKNFTLFSSFRSIILILLLMPVLQAQAQPDYYFSNPVLESGTNLAIGAVYRFSNVKPGVDAMVTITDLTAGMTLDDIDGPSGFDEAFQPYINCPKKSKGYAEFQFDFVKSGTNTPMIMTEVPMTAIDIDGYEFPDEKLYEYDMFKESSSHYVSYDLLGTSLDVKHAAGWYEVVNTTAVTYPGIDTIQTDVMFTMVHANISSIYYRVGAENKSKNSMQRLRSVYFKKFTYTSSLLDASALQQFSGYVKNNQVNLSWRLATNHAVKEVVIEKVVTPATFAAIGNSKADAATQYAFVDEAIGTVNYYRLKLVGITGKVGYSNVLVFKLTVEEKHLFKIYPSLVNNYASVSVTASGREQTAIHLIDLTGRTVYTQSVMLQPGANTFTISDLNGLPKGTYVAVVKTGATVNSQKIIKQ
jgi:hypothetical protein